MRENGHATAAPRPPPPPSSSPLEWLVPFTAPSSDIKSFSAALCYRNDYCAVQLVPCCCFCPLTPANALTANYDKAFKKEIAKRSEFFPKVGIEGLEMYARSFEQTSATKVISKYEINNSNLQFKGFITFPMPDQGSSEPASTNDHEVEMSDNLFKIYRFRI